MTVDGSHFLQNPLWKHNVQGIYFFSNNILADRTSAIWPGIRRLSFLSIIF